MNKFAIHAFCLVKNEGDIIRHCLTEARRWADYIYVLDNGSSDNTWDEVLAIADDHVIPWKRHDMPFQESLRAEIFDAFRGKARPGDWWCQLDGDEFYTLHDPRAFLAGLPRKVHAVSSIYVQYYLTRDDLVSIDFSLPIELILPQIRHYKADHCEPKWFRHRNRLRWQMDQGRPSHLGVMARRQMLMRHYKYRSPEQIQRRLDTRRQARARGFSGWECNATDETWQDKVVSDQATLHYDRADGNIIVEQGIAASHIEPLHRRVFKAAMHNLGVWA